MSVRGWAIKRNGVIDPSTVSATETAAKAKWLMSSVNISIGSIWSEDDIDGVFAQRAAHSTEYPSCIRVNIMEAP